MHDILSIVKDFGPFSTIALSLVIIGQLVRSRKKISLIESNHLHTLNETLNRIEMKLDKLDDIKEKLEYIRAKMNGGS